MISSFYVRNYRSIVELVVDFTYKEGKAPNHYEEMDMLPFLENGKARLSPVYVIYGANAAGKSNILHAMSTLSRLVTLGLCPEHGRIFDPNLLHPECSFTEFRAATCVGNRDYVYSVKYDSNSILEESLLADGEEVFSIAQGGNRFVGLVTQNYPQEKWEDVYRTECCPDGKKAQFTFFQRSAQNYGGISEALREAYDSISRKLFVMPGRAIHNLMPSMWKVLEHEYNGAENLMRELVRILRQFDVGIKGLSLRNDVSGAKRLCSHHFNKVGREVVLDFEEESDGTNELLVRVLGMLLTLRGGGTMVVDEFDASIHPIVLRELVRMMRSRRFNTTGQAQFIFTAHTTDLLDSEVLRLSDVAFVRKSDRKGTMIKGLIEFKEKGEKLRNDSDWRTRYLEGWYSGVPNAAI